MPSSDHQFFRIRKVIISCNNYPIPGLQTSGDLVLARILAADLDGHLHGPRTVRVQLEDPVASRLPVEVSTRNHHGLFGLPQLDLHPEALAETHVVGHLAGEH